MSQRLSLDRPVRRLKELRRTSSIQAVGPIAKPAQPALASGSLCRAQVEDNMTATKEQQLKGTKELVQSKRKQFASMLQLASCSGAKKNRHLRDTCLSSCQNTVGVKVGLRSSSRMERTQLFAATLSRLFLQCLYVDVGQTQSIP